MRILTVGHLNPRMHYGIMQKLMHGLIRLGHTVHHFDDRHIARRATLFGSRKFGIVPMNKQFLSTCEIFQPEVILLGHAEMIWNSTLEKVRQRLPNVRIAYRNVDPLIHEDNINDIHNRTASADCIFITTAGPLLDPFKGKRAKVYYMPNPVDPHVEDGRAFEHTDQPYDVFYAIGGVYKDDPRPGFIQRLQKACPAAKFSVHGMFGAPNLFGPTYLEALLTARMGLNYSRQNDHYLYSSDRMAQYMGNGLLTFIDRATGFEDLFTADEVAFYGDEAELAEKLSFFLVHDRERQRTAEAGWKKIHEIFCHKRIAAYLLDCIFEKTSLSYERHLTAS